jgi:DNA polymerase kappa
MRDLPVRKIPGVGKVNEHILAGLNIYFCKDLVERATDVYVTFTEWAYEFLIKSALGLSRVMHEAQESMALQKSIGVSSTFKSIHRYAQFVEKISSLAEELEKRAGENHLMGRTLCVEFKSYKFRMRIKSLTFPHYLYTKNQFIKYAIILLNQAWPVEATRLMGLRLQNMRDRRKSKDVKVCPEVNFSDINFLHPIEKEDKSKPGEEPEEEEDNEGTNDPAL